MRRVAILLGMVGVIALGLAATPAQAEDGGWGGSGWRGHEWREHEWREHEWREHEWREHRYQYPWFYSQGYYAPRADYAPGVTLGFGVR